MYCISKISAAILFFFKNRVRTWIAKIPRIPVVMGHAIVAPHRVLSVMLALNFLYAQMDYVFAARSKESIKKAMAQLRGHAHPSNISVNRTGPVLNVPTTRNVPSLVINV